MRDNNFRPIYNNDNNFNLKRNNKPYRARNMISAVNNDVKETFIQQIQPQLPTQETPMTTPVQPPVQEAPVGPPTQTPTQPPSQGTPLTQTPTEGTPVEVTPIPEELLQADTGYISVGVFTALGALPVPNAVVTVYTNDEEGEEIVLSHQVTDANGRVADVELPVVYNRLNPLGSSEYFFSTYNLRVQAQNYYTVNVLEARIFPETRTNFRIDLIPVAAGETGTIPEQTFVIPPSPIDISNE